MSWEAAGAIGEIAGAVGVFVTLIYLAWQIRQNSRLLEVQNIRAQAVDRHSFAQIQINPEMLDALEKVYSLDSELSFRDKVLIEAYLISQLASYLADYRLYLAGLTDEGYWRMQAKLIKQTISASWPREYWNTDGRVSYPQDFVEEVEKILDSPDVETDEYWSLWGDGPNSPRGDA